jgi:hypothetical protein
MMVKYMCWMERDTALPMDYIDRKVRAMASEQGQTLQAEPSEYWRREDKAGVQLSSEQFPGSQPIWFWQAV